MGLYNTYEDVALKVGSNLHLANFKIGDQVDIPDGVYVGFEGIVVITEGVFVAKFKHFIDKWGIAFTVDIRQRNPVAQAIEDIAQKE